MSQVTNFDVPGSPLTMSALATALEAVFAALGSINRGAAAPSNPFEGMLWWDSAAVVEILKRYTVTAGWISILSVNRTSGAFALINATTAATANMIALRDASANIKIGTAAADTDALNRVTADGRFGQYSSGSGAAGGDLTGNLYWVRVGNLVAVTWEILTHASSSLVTSTSGVVPIAFRPDRTQHNTFAAGTGRVMTAYVSNFGTFHIIHFDGDLIGTNQTGAVAGSITYIVS